MSLGYPFMPAIMTAVTVAKTVKSLLFETKSFYDDGPGKVFFLKPANPIAAFIWDCYLVQSMCVPRRGPHAPTPTPRLLVVVAVGPRGSSNRATRGVCRATRGVRHSAPAARAWGTQCPPPPPPPPPPRGGRPRPPPPPPPCVPATAWGGCAAAACRRRRRRCTRAISQRGLLRKGMWPEVRAGTHALHVDRSPCSCVLGLTNPRRHCLACARARPGNANARYVGQYFLVGTNKDAISHTWVDSLLTKDFWRETLESVDARLPREIGRWQENKLSINSPLGESDVVVKLEDSYLVRVRVQCSGWRICSVRRSANLRARAVRRVWCCTARPSWSPPGSTLGALAVSFAPHISPAFAVGLSRALATISGTSQQLDTSDRTTRYLI